MINREWGSYYGPIHPTEARYRETKLYQLWIRDGDGWLLYAGFPAPEPGRFQCVGTAEQALQAAMHIKPDTFITELGDLPPTTEEYERRQGKDGRKMTRLF